MQTWNREQQEIIDTIDQNTEVILNVLHEIHSNPELGNREFKATALLQKTLADAGFNITPNFAGIETAFIAQKGSGPNPKIAYLCEYDALPEIGHACGHNVIAATSLAAGIGLASVIDRMGGTVYVIGTPAEETQGAKVAMVDQQLFKDYDAAMMIHAYNHNYRFTNALAVMRFQLAFKGKPSHASGSPWEGINALDAMNLTFAGISAFRQQMKPDWRVHGIITDGGTAPNIIPERTVARFYLRAGLDRELEVLFERFKNIVDGAALMTGATAELFDFGARYDCMTNNRPLAERAEKYAVEGLGAVPFDEAPASFGSIDMGNVSGQCPAIHMLIGITEGKEIPLHTPEFREAANSPSARAETIRISKALALTGLDVIYDEGFRRAVRMEFDHVHQ